MNVLLQNSQQQLQNNKIQDNKGNHSPNKPHYNCEMHPLLGVQVKLCHSSESLGSDRSRLCVSDPCEPSLDEVRSDISDIPKVPVGVNSV